MKDKLTYGERFLDRKTVEYIPSGVRIDYSMKKDTKKFLIVFGIVAGFVLFVIVSNIPTESYAKSVSISNHAWCQQTLKDHAVSGEPISSEIVKMCAKHLGV